MWYAVNMWIHKMRWKNYSQLLFLKIWDWEYLWLDSLKLESETPSVEPTTYNKTKGYDYLLFSDHWFSLLLEKFGILILQLFVVHVTNFEINPRFLIKPFSYMINKSSKKCKYAKSKRAFNINLKNFSSSF